MSTTLQNYITEVQRLLHDTTASIWTTSELTDYINAGRVRTVRDTGCLRQIQTANVSANVEVYTFASTLPNGNVTFDIINVNLFWGNTRVPLYYLPWTNFNSQLRFWQNYQGRPIAFTVYGQQQFYLGPVPDQTYTSELDTIIAPAPLVNTTDVDTINDIFTPPVAFYACYKAKFKQQAFGESEIFKQQYDRQIASVLASTYTRRMYSAYVNRW